MNFKILESINTSRQTLWKAVATILFMACMLLPYPGVAAEYILPAANLDRPTIECLENKDWQCALETLVPLYYEQGSDSPIKHYIAFCYRALAHQALDTQELETAAQMFEEAVGYLDTDAVLFAELGNVYYRLSSYEAAGEALRNAVELDQGRPDYYELLGQISYLTGESGDAIFYWQKALTLKPDNQELKKRLQQLSDQQQAEHQGTTEMSHVFKITFDAGVDSTIYNTVWEILQDSWYDIGNRTDMWPRRIIPVLLLAGEKFTTLTDAPIWAGGSYEGQIKIPVADFDLERLREAISHEYTHALIHDTMAQRCPWWLNEGLAQYFSLAEPKKIAMLGFARDAAKMDSQPDLDSLPGPIRQSHQARDAYALAFSATDFLIERFSLATTTSILLSMGRGSSFSASLAEHTGYGYEEFSTLWLQHLNPE